MISAIARTGNLTRAAEALSVTPSALSHRLAEAERRLGVTLVLREGRHAQLTPAGQTLLQAAEEILERLHQTETDLERLHGGAFERAFRLTLGHYGAYGWFGAFLCGWRAQQENVHVYIRADAQRDPVAALRERVVDIAVVPYAARPEHGGLHSVRLFADELVLVCSQSDPLAHAGRFAPADLAHRDFLTYTRNVVPNQEYERFIRPFNVTVRHWVDMEDPATILDLVANGQGVSILSRWFVESTQQAGEVAMLPVGASGLPVVWHALHRGDATGDTEFEALLAALARHFAGRR